MHRRSLVVALAAAIGGATLATPAHGLIVWDGKVVPAWPDEPRVAPPAGAAFAAANIGLYQHPKGNVYGLTLLIDFSDTAPAFTKAQIDDWLNLKGYKTGGLNGSVRDYYLDESNGQVDFQNEIFGFYRAKQPKAHYESTAGYEGSDELFAEIMDYFDASVDFSKYDNDKDGRTDAISIVYAGESVTWGKGLWPHASGSNLKRDGVTIARYMMTNLGTSLGLYTFSHEVGHMLFGWPDLYGFGNYCIMGNGSSTTNPVGINDFFRADQGWIPLVDVTKDTNAVFTATRNGAGYRYANPKDPNESFFWSNVQSSGRFSTISGDGLLLLHFDKKIGTNDPPKPLCLAVVQADGKKDLDQVMWPEPGSDAKDFFQGAGVHEFSGTTFATAKWNDGTASDLHIYDVANISENMQFKVGNGPIVDVGGAGGSGGASGGVGGVGGVNAGGTTSGGMNASGAAGRAGSAGAPSGAGGAVTVGGGSGGAGGSSPSAAAGSLATGGSGSTGLGGTGGVAAASGQAQTDGSCSCRLVSAPGDRRAVPLALVLLGGLFRRRRRVFARSR